MTPRLRPEDESGAVMAIVALMMIALLGMIVLVVDVGGLLTMRRRMVIVADSAALAAAQSCAAEDPVDAPLQADSLATANEDDATRKSYEPTNCGTSSSGSVKVAYEAPKELFFAPLLGAPQSRAVSATATAIWGPAGGTSPVPIEFSVDANGRIPCIEQPIGSTCNYWHDNSTDYGVEASSSWGFMNLSQWGVAPGDSCSSAGSSERTSWITGADKANVVVDNPPVLVCIDTGHSTSSWLAALQSQIGKIKHFPINDPSSMVLSPPGKAKYAIIGFAALKVEEVLKGNDPDAVGTRGPGGKCSSSASFTSGSKVDLDSLGCYSNPPDDITELTLSKKDQGQTTVYQSGVHYTFDAQTHEITWLTAPQTDVLIDFDWSNAGSPGKCGSHKPDPNAVCLVMSWQGAQVGGSVPGGGMDFGLRAVRLSE